MDTMGFMMLWVLPFLAAFFAVWLVVAFFFLLNLRGLLSRVNPQNRTMSPDEVWLNLIPLFNLVWMFITVIRVRDSVQAEFRSRGWAAQGDFGFSIGLAAAILSVIGWLGSLPGLICWIIYWVRMSELKHQLLVAQPLAGWAALPTPPSTMGMPQQGGQRTCAYCGKAVEAGDAFCRSCGRPIA